MPTATASGKKFNFPDGTTNEQMAEAIDEYFSSQSPESIGSSATTPIRRGGTGSSGPSASARRQEELSRLRETQPADVMTAEDTGSLEAFGVRAGRALDSIGSSVKQLGAGIGRGITNTEIARLEGEIASATERGDMEKVARLEESLSYLREGNISARQEEADIAQYEREAEQRLRPLDLTHPDATALGRFVGTAVPAAAGGLAGASTRALPIIGAVESQVLTPATGETEEARAKERATNLAIGAAVPAAIGGASSGLRRLATGSPNTAQTALIESGERRGVPVMTSDVLPPETAAGKLAQQFGEKIPFVGTGKDRAVQQKARQEAVESLAREFNVELDSPLAQDIVKSLQVKNKVELEKAAIQRRSALQKLDPFGEVPIDRTLDTIETLYKKEKMKASPDEGFMREIDSLFNNLQKRNFSLLKDDRSDIIEKLKSINRSEDRKDYAKWQAVKSALDKDMISFASRHDRRAAADWLRSNRKISEELTTANKTALKKLINDSNAPPENVYSLIRSSKPSQLVLLKDSLTDKGRANVRASIVRDALDESGFFRGDINPDKLATALGKSPRQKAINVFFSEADKKQIEGLRKLLNETRRAQQSNVATPTGMQYLSAGAAGTIGAASAGSPGALAAIFTGASAGLISRVYESKPVRNALLRISNSEEGSPEYYRAINMAAPVIMQAAEAIKEYPSED